jgi:4,5-DOPA dioxygenase extradiol
MSHDTLRMPAVFFGHGSPMNALEMNRHTAAWAQFGKRVPRPRGIVCVSAHWYIRGTAVTAMSNPKTIHDFGGFPQALFEVQYPAPGDPALAARVKELLAPTAVIEDTSGWGLDHGTWSVLKHVYPEADIPVVQLAIDGTKSLGYHYELAKRLAPLRDEGVLVAGSGNVVHNLRTVAWDAGAAPHPWATRFNEAVRSRLLANDHASLVDMDALGADGAMSIPTPEHYLPLLYVIALRRPDDRLVFLTDGIELGSIGMMSVSIGEARAGDGAGTAVPPDRHHA